MTNTTRRLSAEMRQLLLKGYPNHPLADALHDLDVADRERAAAQATIAEQKAFIDNDLCDIRLDNEAQGAEIHKLKRAIAQKSAVIAAMREPLSSLWQLVNLGDCPLTEKVVAALTDTTQLAADHDEQVRAPLEARIKELEEAQNART